MYYIGIDLGGTNIAAGIVDENCNMIVKGSVPTGRMRAFSEIMKDISDLSLKLLEDAGLKDCDIGAIGIVCPGTFDIKNGIVKHASNIPSFTNAPVTEELNKYFPDTKIYIENDANAAAYGETLCGAAKGIKDAVMVTIGTGIGGGIVIDGKIYPGFYPGVAELGHMVIKYDGVPCGCGRNGCFEAYGSVNALIRETSEIIDDFPESIIHDMIACDKSNISGRTAFDAMRKGDMAGQKIVDQYIEYLGIGVINLISIFQPEIIVLGGGISKEGDYILAPLREYVEKYKYSGKRKNDPRVKIVCATLGNDAGIIGAAMLYRQA